MTVAAELAVTVGSRRIPVVLPNLHDPRLKVSAIVTTLQVLGQTVLGFKVSVAQILVTVGASALLDAALVLHRDGVLAWPASGLLTGNSVAFILRASGTQHGDWWSLRGIHLFVAVAVFSVLSKHLIRLEGRHVFNPSNVGLVWGMLVVGPARLFPQYLWWGSLDAPVIAALAVIAFGVIWILRPIGMLEMVATHLVVFGGIVVLLAASGRGFFAVWHQGFDGAGLRIEGLAYVIHIMASPELLIFVFFMMTDPQTVPRGRWGRVAFGAATAVASGLLIAFQGTEFGIKLGILGGLTVVTALTALLAAPRPRISWRTPAAIAVVIISVGATVDTLVLPTNEKLLLIERGVVRNIQ